MTSIADRLTDIQQRIAQSERRIAELKRAPTVEFLFIEMASAALIQLREYQNGYGRSNLPSVTC
jgi:hypothetical protein